MGTRGHLDGARRDPPWEECFQAEGTACAKVLGNLWEMQVSLV